MPGTVGCCVSIEAWKLVQKSADEHVAHLQATVEWVQNQGSVRRGRFLQLVRSRKRALKVVVCALLVLDALLVFKL